MIILYSPFETDFTHNGLAVLDDICSKAEITQEVNGDYSLYLEVKKDIREKYLRIQPFSIIKADGQLFRAPIQENIQDNGISIKLTAKHIFYDMLYDFNLDTRAVNKTVQEALQICVALNSKFTITTCDSLGIDTAYFIRENPIKSIFDKILPRWGGEIYRDNFNISIKQRLGKVSGYIISFGKNIKGFKQKTDFSNLCTRMHPVGNNGLELDSVYINSPRINDYPIIATREYSFDVDTKTDLQNEAEKLWGTVDIPTSSYEVDFEDLSKTTEYEKLKFLLSLDLGDTVTIKHSIFNVNINARVIKTVKDILTDKYTKLYLGDYIANINDTVNSISSRVSSTEEKVTDLSNSITLNDEVITAHINNTDIHVTSAEKNNWNNAETNAKAYTDDSIANLVDSSPATLNTLNELAQALGDDPNFATTILNQLSQKAAIDDLNSAKIRMYMEV